MQCAPYKQDELCFILKDILLTRKAFLNDHRYDPFEIYCTDEFLDELKDIPDPKKEPLEFLDIMLHVLQEMGPWSADRVAFNMYQRIEKQKIKTPHERHYILLCLVNTALLEVHAICEQNFRKFKNNHKNCVETHSSPKVLRLLEVLRLFKPEDNTSKNDTIKRISTELDQMDFQKLSRILETKCHSVEQAVEKQQLESRSIVENLDSIVKPDFQSKLSVESIQQLSSVDSENKAQNSLKKTDDISHVNTSASTNHRHSGSHHNRPKRRPFRRHNRDNNDGADTLCSIIFCNSSYIARVLFELLAEMSRHDSDLKFIKCQFTTDRVADPITEPKEAEVEHRRQEEVLKRFRMHDCNVLIGTSVLEEGIDVPKCNLVVRWDPPTTYRSYVQCKGRARAVPAYHVVLVASDVLSDNHKLTSSNEQLTDKSHRIICELPEDQDCFLTESEQSNGEDDDKQINGVSTKQKFVYGSSKGTIKILNPEVITNKHPSKPFTGSDLVLKEIEDVTLAIKDVSNDLHNDSVNVKEIELADSSSTTHNQQDSKIVDINNSNIKIKSELISSNLNESVIESNEHYKTFDLNMIIDGPTNIENPKENINSLEVSKEQLLDHGNVVENIDIDISDALTDLDISKSQGNEIKTTTLDPKQKNDKKDRKIFRCLLQCAEEGRQGQSSTASFELHKFENMKRTTDEIIKQMAEYREIEKVCLIISYL